MLQARASWASVRCARALGSLNSASRKSSQRNSSSTEFRHPHMFNTEGVGSNPIHVALRQLRLRNALTAHYARGKPKERPKLVTEMRFARCITQRHMIPKQIFRKVPDWRWEIILGNFLFRGRLEEPKLSRVAIVHCDCLKLQGPDRIV